MIILEGKYNKAKVMIDQIDSTTQGQVLSFLNHPAFEGTNIAIMPDCHAGKGSVIGFTSTINDYLIANVIGVDIGCGVDTYNIGPQTVDFEKFDKYLRENIPSGFSIRDAALKIPAELSSEIDRVCTVINGAPSKTKCAVGTLGGGNHYIELNIDDQKNIWISVHTGSRKFGMDVATCYQKKAVAYSQSIHPNKELCWLSPEEAKNYMRDMKVAQEFARYNRLAILTTLMQYFNLYKFNEDQYITSVHNYIDFEDGIMRKGAISAHQGQRVIIPLNMRDGSIVGVGKGNAEWNYSAPHGAGRLFSRGEAKRKFVLAQYQETMEGVWSSCIKQSTLDEAPMAYKDASTIVECIKETVDISFIMKPVYNFKASE